MISILKKIRGIYAFVCFGIVFLLLLPLFLIPMYFPSQFAWTGRLNRWWGKLFMSLALMPFRIEMRGKLDPKKRYIFCANHASYLDIPTLSLCPINTVFVGKRAMSKIPVFGWMYARLHITVDRSKMSSKADSLRQALQALDEGKNLSVFPEGGIVSKTLPKMAPFKNGPFRMSIEKQADIVPVSIPNNWFILPDESIRMTSNVVKVIFHEPISVTGKTMNDLAWLKQTTYDIIQAGIDEDLKKNHPAHWKKLEGAI